MTVISPFSGTPESQHAKIENSPSQPILVMQKPSAPVAGTGKSQTKSKPRKRVNTAEKRNQHNAIERQRRETLNGKFLSLARVLPALASHRRPSKSAIVNGSISHLSFQGDQRLLASRLLRQLCADRDALAKEVNEWRAANGFARQESLTAWCDEMEEVCNVEKEVFGNFANMEDGDDEGDMDQDGEYAGPDFVGDRERESDLDLGLGLGFNGLTNVNRGGNMSLEQAAIVAAANVDVNVAFNPMSGMITPRTSTDMDFPSYGLNMPMPHKDLLPMGSGQVPQPRVQLHQHQMQLPQQQQQSGINWADFTFANPVTAASGNANMKSAAAADLSSSTGSLPFNAFMAESLASSSSPSGCSPTSGGNGIPTPPTTAEFGSGFTHTPSPRSSHSGSGGNGVDDNKVPVLPAHAGLGRSMSQQPWNEQQQQLMLLHSVQQQQLQQRQQAQASMLQQTPHPAHASLHVNVNGTASMRSQTLPQTQSQGNHGQVPFNPAAAAAFGPHGFTGGNGGADVVALMSMLSQHQQHQQQSNAGGNGQGNGNGYNVPSQPQLHRAQTEQMDAWRRMTIAGGNIGGGGVWA